MKSHSYLPPDEGKKRITAKQWYETNAERIFEEYERFSFEETHEALLSHLPKDAGLVLDVGAGTGRDAAGFARLGHDVVAVEPNEKLRSSARGKHKSEKIRWVNDSLPKLAKVRRNGLTFDVISLSAVWMHVAPSERRRAFRRLASLLSPGGLMCITLRHGSYEPVRGFWEISPDEVLEFARDFGLFSVSVSSEPDQLGRADVTWTRIILRSPGDGTGALPLLRGIVLNDNKSSTYKLALLRVLVRIGQSSAGLARLEGEDRVVLPLGLFALYWLRLYRPLLDENLPQNPSNTTGTLRIGFANEAFQQLQDLSSLDFRIGASFRSIQAKTLHRALQQICSTLSKMPMHYITYPGSSTQVFAAQKQQRVQAPSQMTLDATYLFSFGTVRIPFELWQAAQKFGVWIEPAINAEWKELMKGYARSQNRAIDLGTVENALMWGEPNRTTAYSRKRAEDLFKKGAVQRCVWSNSKLRLDTMDIDHCFPYSAWPCADLWNLLPVHRKINQRQKKDKLPGLITLNESRERILEWWDSAYIDAAEIIRQQFFNEAQASLRLDIDVSQHPDEIFDSMTLQQTQLKFNQQIPEWNYSP